MKTWWAGLMEAKNNSLRVLPKWVRLQLMVVLSFMWSLIFCISLSIIYLFPEVVVIHIVLVVCGIFGTSWLFSLFEKGK
jgi:hypothetical protein